MNPTNEVKRRLRVRRTRMFLVEVLEGRALLAAAAETFTGPSLTNLIVEAYQGRDTSVAAIDKMLTAYQTQLTSGPLADLKAGTVTSNEFVQEVQNLEESFEANTDKQLLPNFPNVDQLIKLSGQRTVADVISLNQQNAVGLITSSELEIQATTAINALSDGPIYPLHTPLSAYSSTTSSFETNLNTLASSLSTGATTPLTINEVSNTLTTEAEAYRANLHAGLQITHPNISSTADDAINALETTVSGLAATNPSDAQTQLQTAITTFDNAILDSTGLFGPKGPVAQVVNAIGYVPHNLTVSRTSTAISGVAGTAEFGGTATLTATLKTASGTAIAGKSIFFTLDGAFVGTATTDSTGLATLTGVTTTDAVGTDTGGIAANFAGDIGYVSNDGSGNLVVSKAPTALASVAGTSTFGGTATLTATLTSTVTNAGLAGQTVSFTLNGTTVGTATTDSNGVATLTGVVNTSNAGTSTGAVVASYAGDSSYLAATNGTGNLVVSKAGTALSAASGTANFGGTATLTATLDSSVTNGPISGATVSFKLDGTSVGTATTNASGVATLTGVATSAAVGTDSGGVVASYAGDSNYNAATDATGNLVVSKANTAFSAVAGTATGGTASLTATLKSSVTNAGLSGITVSFTLDSVSVGTAVTNGSGVATLSGIANSDSTGTHTGAVVVSFAGNSSYNAPTNGTGDLVVS